MAEESTLVELDSFTAKILRNVDSRRRKLEAILAGQSEDSSPVPEPVKETPNVFECLPPKAQSQTSTIQLSPVKILSSESSSKGPQTQTVLEDLENLENVPQPNGQPRKALSPKFVEPLAKKDSANNNNSKKESSSKVAELKNNFSTQIKADSQSIVTATKAAIQTGKKDSVSNLKSLFEQKIDDLSKTKTEIAPELLTLKDKKRLFEKAIREETANYNKQKELFNKPKKRFVDWMPMEEKSSDENDAKKNRVHSPPKTDSTVVVSTSVAFIPIVESEQKDIHEVESHQRTSLVEKDMSIEEDGIMPEGKTYQDGTISAILSVSQRSHMLEDIYPDEDEDYDDDESVLTSDRIVKDSDDDIDQTHHLDDAMVESCKAVDDAFKEINTPSCTSSEAGELHSVFGGIVNEHTIDITFSVLDNDFGENINLQRSSTKVNLSSESMEQEPLPEKPPRMYAYNEASLQVRQNPDEDCDDFAVAEQHMDNDEQVNDGLDCQDPPPMRTISFYRREQKLKKEAALSSAQSRDSPVRYLKQNIVSQSIDMKSAFVADIQEKIEQLKAEIKEHNRVSNQASTALNMCLGYTDPQFEESRIEAEKLLLVSAEKRSACLNQIQRYVSVLRNPNMYSIYAENAPRASVTLADIRVPFKSEFLVSRAKGKQNSTFHFICLLVCKGVVHASKVLTSDDNVGQDVLDFEFGSVFDDLTRDFQITLKIFSMEMNREAKHKENKTFRIKFGTPSSSKSKGTPANITSTSSFQSVGQVYIRLQSMAENKSGLYRMKLDTLSTPLDGYVTMDVGMDVDHRLCAEGFFDIQEESTSFWNLRYFKLAEKELMIWRFKDDVKDKAPIEVIELKNCINPHFALLQGTEREICMRPNTFVILTVHPPKVSNAEKLLKGGVIHKVHPKRYFISSQSKEDSSIFCEQLNKVLQNIRAWEADTVRPYSIDEFNRILMSKQ